MTNVIDDKEAERLMKPENLGMRLTLLMGRIIAPEDTLGASDQEMLKDILGRSKEERNENLRVVRALEQEMARIVIERGGSAPELIP